MFIDLFTIRIISLIIFIDLSIIIFFLMDSNELRNCQAFDSISTTIGHQAIQRQFK